jgi:hypothetical protein
MTALTADSAAFRPDKLADMNESQVAAAEDPAVPQRAAPTPYWGGLLFGLGLGTCLSWGVHIYESGNPRPLSNVFVGNPSSLYPSFAVTVVIIFAASLALGLGLSIMVAALIGIRGRDVLRRAHKYLIDGPAPARRAEGPS